MKLLISLGAAKTITAGLPWASRSTMTGFPGRGPTLLESVLKRRSNSEILWTRPSAVCIRYVSTQ